VNHPEEADILVAGFSKDFKDESERLSILLNKKPSLRLVILSEEPLWDSLWSGEFWKPKGSFVDGSFNCQFDIFNHVTTPIYHFQKFPYFITTSDDYFVRYHNFFRRNAQLSDEDILSVWQQAPIRQAYFAENRSGATYDFSNKELDMFGLSSFRTGITELANNPGVLRVGQGWGGEIKRQTLPDWHLDKLATLNRQSFIVSAIENTHQRSYISEKIFDAFAVLGIPLYVASPQHSVHRVLSEGSYINLYGLSITEAIDTINSFEPTIEFLSAYRQTQASLAELFNDAEGFWAERKRVINQIINSISEINGSDSIDI
jgi:hypothetical protein